MATYTEINDLLKISDASGLRNRVAVATMVKADIIRLETDDATQPVRERKRFSQQIYRQAFAVFSDAQQSELNNAPLVFTPIFEGVYRAVLMANRTSTVANITGATDTQIQNNVNDAVDHLAASYTDPVVP